MAKGPMARSPMASKTAMMATVTTVLDQRRPITVLIHHGHTNSNIPFTEQGASQAQTDTTDV